MLNTNHFFDHRTPRALLLDEADNTEDILVDSIIEEYFDCQEVL